MGVLGLPPAARPGLLLILARNGRDGNPRFPHISVVGAFRTLRLAWDCVGRGLGFGCCGGADP